MVRKSEKKRILVVAGSSGGHIFPALAFLDTLKQRHKELDLLLVLPKRNIIKELDSLGHKTRCIALSSFPLTLDFKIFGSILNLLKGSLESLFTLLIFKPDIVVGFGSFTCVPFIMFAWLFRIDNLIHEQNVICGRANRFLVRFTDRIAVSFAETKERLRNYQKKIVVIGNPIRKGLTRIEKNEALDYFGFARDKFTILVMGGSQGSHRVNTAFLKAAAQLMDKSKFQVIHLSGVQDYDLLKEAYGGLNISNRLFSFLGAMQYAYSASDLVLSRAGATTISEVIFYRLPAIIIPYPFAQQHQLENAAILEKMGSAVIIKDEALDDIGAFKESLEGLINNRDRIKMMRSRYDAFPAAEAGNLLVEEVLHSMR
jgi:UDP-N-acetylglucosamine--N-acetylmuramyl-(pentapeptide) pyrophosphoryl-undecaprenol N-acetylglucosamine transferase